MVEPVADGRTRTQAATSSPGLVHPWAPGGVGGTGLGFDSYAHVIPELTSDMIFAAIGTEMGLIGAVAVVMAFILHGRGRLPGGPDGAQPTSRG